MTETDTELERRLRELSLADGARADRRTAAQLNTGRAWHELRARRERSASLRRRGMITAAVAAAAALVIAVPVLSRSLSTAHAPPPSQPRPAAPPPVGTYPGAIAASIPMTGVVAMAGDRSHAYVIRRTGQDGLVGGYGGYQLVSVDLPSGTAGFRDALGGQQPAIAAGPGALWITTPDGQAGGQIISVDPETGRFLMRYHLPAGQCTALSFSSARLYASCDFANATRTVLFQINWRTNQARRVGPVLPGGVSSIIATPRALWYAPNGTEIRGFLVSSGKARPLTADWGGYQVSPGGEGLIYASGSIWALAPGEQLARIDPVTGRVQRIYTYRNYDPSRLGGLDFLTAGGGWLWFLDNGYPFSGVLRVSMAAGHPDGGIPVAPNSCGQQTCSQVYYLDRSIWVPTAELLLRIDPGRLPG